MSKIDPMETKITVRCRKEFIEMCDRAAARCHIDRSEWFRMVCILAAGEDQRLSDAAAILTTGRRRT